MNNKNQNKKVYVYLLITFFAWGSLHAVNRYLVGYLDVFVILFLRYLLASIFSFFVLYIVGRNGHGGQQSIRSRIMSIKKEDFKYVVLIGIVGYVGAVILQLLGTKYSNASISSVVNAVNPLFIIIFASIILREKVTTVKLICLILALTGTFIIGCNVTGRVTFGVIYSGVAAMAWAASTVITRKISFRYDVSVITFWSLILAMVCLMLFAVHDILKNGVSDIPAGAYRRSRRWQDICNRNGAGN